MNVSIFHQLVRVACSFILVFSAIPVQSQADKSQQALDDRVKKFLEANRYNWHDMNVPYQDGQVLHDLIVKVGGCFTAHNVRNNYGGTKEFDETIEKPDNYVTTIDKSSRSGISISYKKSN